MVEGEELKNLIKNRIEKFWGYGNLKSNIWFVGMEEGFTGEKKDLIARFQRTQGKEVIDIVKNMKGITDHIRFFEGERPPIQRTWKVLIWFLLKLCNNNFIYNTNDIRNFQKNCFGREDGNHAILDLMPLPVNNTNIWPDYYKTIGEIKIGDTFVNLRSREEYKRTLLPLRINQLTNLIHKHHPKVVIFYGLSYKQERKQIINNSITIYDSNQGFYYTISTRFFIIPHPTTQGLSNDNWEQIINKIINLINNDHN